VSGFTAAVPTDRVAVPAGAVHVRTSTGVVSALGLGSCVALVMHDPAAHVGGIAHVLLPAAPADAAEGAVRYGDRAVSTLVRRLTECGASPDRLRVWLVGGATMFPDLMPPGRPSIGVRNVEALRAALTSAGMSPVAEAVGGEVGRSVHLDVGLGTVTVATARGTPHAL